MILGANDHGKTNLLNALLHLNEEHEFVSTDINFDRKGAPDSCPSIHYELTLSADERKALRAHLLERAHLEAFTRARVEAAAELHQAATQAAPPVDASETESSEQRTARIDELRHRVGLLYAEELRRTHSQHSEADFDATERLASVEAALPEAQARNKKARARTTSSRTALEQAPEGTPEREKAAAAVAAAEAALEESSAELERLSSEADLLRLAVDAIAATNDGTRQPPKEARIAQPRIPTDQVPEGVCLARIGVGGQLSVCEPGEFSSGALFDFVRQNMPRVELFKPVEHIPDRATRESIHADDNDFMRGIFRYAGIEPDEWDGLFDQTDETTMRIDSASGQLNDTLRSSWSQGKDLRFKLDHNEGVIDLQIQDPSVTKTFVRASQRSSGFTHFFALKTMLYARERDARASSFLWLFDEPGIYLHPQGQHDLLQVLETLAQSNQIAYVTHSIFLTNKNYPTRHRLLIKTTRGTEVDQKPYAGKWRAAIEALGLGFPGTFLFASHILLVEGDADPILLYADIQKLIETGEFKADINGLSVMATGNSRHADALIRIFGEAPTPPRIAVLLDGDQGGSDRYKSLKKLLDAKGVLHHQLDAKTTLEDHLVSPSSFREAVVRYLDSLAPDKGVRAKMDAAPATGGLSIWARVEGQKAIEADEPPSSVGMAREYALLLQGVTLDSAERNARRKAVKLARKIAEMLDLPGQTVEQDQIVDDTPSPG